MSKKKKKLWKCFLFVSKFIPSSFQNAKKVQTGSRDGSLTVTGHGLDSLASNPSRENIFSLYHHSPPPPRVVAGSKE
jgi:hypothetical protein